MRICGIEKYFIIFGFNVTQRLLKRFSNGQSKYFLLQRNIFLLFVCNSLDTIVVTASLFYVEFISQIGLGYGIKGQKKLQQ